MEISVKILGIDTNLIIISFLKINLTEMFTSIPSICMYKVFIIVLFVMANIGKNLNVHQ